MEQNLPLVAKKAWGIVRVIFFMLRRGLISKRKLLLDLNMMMKRGNKIASKAIGNLMFHHHHHHSAPNSPPPMPATEYEFSCSNTPTHHLPTFHRGGRTNRHSAGGNGFLSCAFHAPPTREDNEKEQEDTVNAVRMALEIINGSNNSNAYAPSPMLPGFGKSPMRVRQLRITDSPFPLREEDAGDNGVVDKKADEFIANFYRELQKQRGMDS
ncbi:unnamed protein product [Linum tenue]|uniref:Avr9/Cf-9 rapidly elicited protein 146 n=1 Tax=Linum tenue TaxID=586396 RepID=A0AAV0KLZ3_9ROSI|nr:unnamed protein product [Linum tenue]